MSVESASNIKELVASNPTMSDPVHEGPQHFAMLKRVLKLVFPGKDGQGLAAPITATEDEFNRLVGVKAGIQAQFDSLAAGTVAAGLACIYPLGSIYISTTNVNPATTMGFGTWERFAQGRVLVSVADGDAEFGAPATPSDPVAAQSTYKQGGSKVSILPAHTHSASLTLSGAANSGGEHGHTTDGAGGHSHGGWTGPMNQNAQHQHRVVLQGYNYYAGGGQKSAFNDWTSGMTLQNFEMSDFTNTDHAHGIPWEGPHAHTISGGGTHSHSLSGSANGTTAAAGADPATGNLPPYLAVYMWRRVA